MNVLSLFSGIGGIDLAFEQAGATVVAQCEIDKNCRALLAERFPDVPCYEDVKDLDGTSFRGIDLIAGGFPCQNVSVAGRREGLDGDRSRLWWEFRRILDESRPRWCLIENVPGLLTTNRGRDMGAILGALGKLGYGFAYRVLNAEGFGVPQRRRRVFIVGHLGNPAVAAQVLLEPESGGGNPPPRKPKGQVASALTASGLGGGGPDDNLAQANHLIPTTTGTLTSRSRAGGFPGTAEAVDGFVIPFRKRRRPTTDENDPETWEQADHANTLDAGSNVTRTAHAIAFHQIQDPITSEELSPALGAKSSGMGVCGDWGVRRLTPVECERLMGFKDGWTEGFSDTQRYKMLGNSVCVPLVRWIAERILQFA